MYIMKFKNVYLDTFVNIMKYFLRLTDILYGYVEKLQIVCTISDSNFFFCVGISTIV